jgi:hypothetical protein
MEARARSDTPGGPFARAACAMDVSPPSMLPAGQEDAPVTCSDVTRGGERAGISSLTTSISLRICRTAWSGPGRSSRLLTGLGLSPSSKQ